MMKKLQELWNQYLINEVSTTTTGGLEKSKKEILKNFISTFEEYSPPSLGINTVEVKDSIMLVIKNIFLEPVSSDFSIFYANQTLGIDDIEWKKIIKKYKSHFSTLTLNQIDEYIIVSGASFLLYSKLVLISEDI